MARRRSSRIRTDASVKAETAEKRKVQNRVAQRAFRERRSRLVEALQSEVRSLKSSNESLQNRLEQQVAQKSTTNSTDMNDLSWSNDLQLQQCSLHDTCVETSDANNNGSQACGNIESSALQMTDQRTLDATQPTNEFPDPLLVSLSTWSENSNTLLDAQQTQLAQYHLRMLFSIISSTPLDGYSSLNLNGSYFDPITF